MDKVYECILAFRPSSLSDSPNVRLRETPRKKFADERVLREPGAEFRWKLRGKSVNYEATFNNESNGRSSLGRHHHLSCLLFNSWASAGRFDYRGTNQPPMPYLPLAACTPSRTLSAHIDPFFALTHSCLAIFAILGACVLHRRRESDVKCHHIFTHKKN